MSTNAKDFFGISFALIFTMGMGKTSKSNNFSFFLVNIFVATMLSPNLARASGNTPLVCSYNYVDFKSVEGSRFNNDIGLNCLRGSTLNKRLIFGTGADAFVPGNAKYEDTLKHLLDYSYVSEIAQCDVTNSDGTRTTCWQNSSAFKSGYKAEITRVKRVSQLTVGPEAAFRRIQEYSIDDFVDFVNSGQKAGMALVNGKDFLINLFDSVQSQNSKLKIGITLYEDQITSSYYKFKRYASTSDIVKIPEVVRNRIDVVHLYFHHRHASVSSSRFVEAAQRRFPNAKVIVGLYNFNRVQAEGGTSNSSTIKTDIADFTQAVKNAKDLMETGRTQGTEFWFGAFKREDFVRSNYYIKRGFSDSQADANMKVFVQMEDIVHSILGQ